MARKQDVGHLPAFVFCRTGVDGSRQEIVLETVGEGTLLVADDAGNHADHGIGNDGCREFAAGQHIVAYGNFAGNEMVAHTLVHAFIVAAEYDDVFLQGEVVSQVLVELLSVGRGEDNLVVVAFGLQRRDASVDGFYLHHHPGKTAIGIVVHAAPFVECVVAQVVEMNLSEPLFLCPCQDAFPHKSFNHLWQHGNDVYSHIICLRLQR